MGEKMKMIVARESCLLLVFYMRYVWLIYGFRGFVISSVESNIYLQQEIVQIIK